MKGENTKITKRLEKKTQRCYIEKYTASEYGDNHAYL
jgi:hypothetical protein